MTRPAADRNTDRLDRRSAAGIVTARTDHLKTGPTAGFLTIAERQARTTTAENFRHRAMYRLTTRICWANGPS